jgi:AcrR family transcriptional regulator
LRVNLEARAATAELRKKRTRERLIEAALLVIADIGPEAASVEDFVAAAGVSRGTFYNYFPTIADLTAALNEALMTAFNSELEAAVAGIRDPGLFMAMIVHATLRQVTGDPRSAWVMMRLENANAPRAQVMVERFDAIYAWGVERGRFRDCDRQAARQLVFGGARIAGSEILAGRTDLEHTGELVALMLAGFGVDWDEARALSRQAQDRLGL